MPLDKDIKWHFKILTVTLLLQVFMYVDTHYLPTKTKKETISSKNEYFQRRRSGGGSYTYTIYTNIKRYEVDNNLFSKLEHGNVILTKKSAITSTLLSVSILGNEFTETFNESYLTTKGGIIWLILVSLLTVLFIIFYNKVGNEQGRKNMTYVLLGATVLVFLNYLQLDFLW